MPRSVARERVTAPPDVGAQLSGQRGIETMAEPFIAAIDHENLHVAIRVRDMDQALAFYRDLVGLPIVRWDRRAGQSDHGLAARRADRSPRGRAGRESVRDPRSHPGSPSKMSRRSTIASRPPGSPPSAPTARPTSPASTAMCKRSSTAIPMATSSNSCSGSEEVRSTKLEVRSSGPVPRPVRTSYFTNPY